MFIYYVRSSVVFYFKRRQNYRLILFFIYFKRLQFVNVILTEKDKHK